MAEIGPGKISWKCIPFHDIFPPSSFSWFSGCGQIACQGFITSGFHFVHIPLLPDWSTILFGVPLFLESPKNQMYSEWPAVTKKPKISGVFFPFFVALKGPKRHVAFCVPTSFLDTSTNIRHQNLYALNYALEVQRPLKCSPRTFQKCMELFIHPKLGNILWVFDFQGCSFQFRYSLLLPMNEPVCANRKQPNGDNGSSHWHSSRLGIRP